MLCVPPIIAPTFLWGDRIILACELYQTLFGAGAYTESDKALHGREVWPRETSPSYTVWHKILTVENFDESGLEKL